jgi:hypothetical protein
METPQTPPLRRQRVITAAAYLMLLALGVMQGILGSFNYGRSPEPVVAIGFAVLIFATCLLAGWGMQTLGGGMVPALGWIVASFIIAMPNKHGSVIITNTAAGQWYLYGGALAAAAGASTSFRFWARRMGHRP